MGHFMLNMTDEKCYFLFIVLIFCSTHKKNLPGKF